jgi:uncharacterized delta-60 repeat protein
METKPSFSWRALKYALLITGVFGVIVGFTGRTPAQLDPAFGTGGIKTIPDSREFFPITTLAMPDGKILIVAQVYLNSTVNYLIRLNSDGSFDTSFGAGGFLQVPVTFNPQSANACICGAALQPDGKIILVGSNEGKAIVVRLNGDATLDTGFGGTGIVSKDVSPNNTDRALNIMLMPDGKILTAGETIGPWAAFFLRFNPDGTPDSTWGAGQGVVVNGLGAGPGMMGRQSDGKIVLRVGFSNGGYIRRLNVDGSFDSTFLGNSNNTVYLASAVQADDKILVAGTTQTTESFDRGNYNPKITRFNADGTLDTTFGDGGIVTFEWARYQDDFAPTLIPLPDGRILAGGNVNVSPNRSKYRGSIGGFALLSPTGSVNSKFITAGAAPPAGSYMDWRSNIVMLPNGNILFTGYDFNNSLNPRTTIKVAEITGVPNESYRFKATPFDLKAGYDGKADPIIFRPSTSTWYFGGVFGLPGDILTPADFMHKGYDAELAVFRPGNGTWYISPNYNGGPTNITAIQWGQNGDIPVQADYDGDEKDDVAVFRPSNGAWYIRNSSDNSATIVSWGLNGDKPVPGDYDGDGKADIAIFRPSNGTWYIIKSSGGQMFVNFGSNGDIPVQEDYDGDGKADIAVWRPSSGVWYRINSSDNSVGGMPWGLSDDIAVPADYDGDSKTDIAIWRPATAVWYIYQSSTDQMSAFNFGFSTDTPVAARH